MKTNVMLLMCLILSVMVFGQNETKNSTLDKNVIPAKFTMVENATASIDADNSSLLNNYLAKNVIYPKKAAEYCLEGTEVIQFTVTPTGKITNINIANSVCCEIDDAVIRVLKKTNGMWKPGYKNGEPVATNEETSIMFNYMNFEHSALVKHFTEKAAYYFTKGSKNLLVENKPKKALRNYDMAMRYLPKNKSLLTMQGICLYELGDKEGARTAWNKAAVQINTNTKELDYDLTAMKGYAEMIAILSKD